MLATEVKLMRVYAMVLCLVLGSAAAARAEGPTFGVKGGVNFANVNVSGDGSADVNFDRRTGGVGGVFVLFPVGTGPASLQIEGLFSQKGAKVDEDGFAGKLKLNYFDIPVLLRLSSGSTSSTSFHVFGGPSVGFRLGAHATDDLTEDGSGSQDISDDVERIDFGVVAGVGVQSGRFSVDARQQWGLSNIVKNPDEGEKFKTRTFSVMVGVRF